MVIKQILNNNVVIALDDSDNEIIVMARGIGFKCKIEDKVNESNYRDVKKYVLNDAGYEEFQRAYESIPQDIIELSSTLLEKEKKQKNIPNISINAVLLLADHINETIKRLKKGLYLRNALSNEIKMFYADEFEIGKLAKSFLLEKYEVVLDDDEISFIVTHLINLNSNNMNETIVSIQIVDELVNIVRRMMNIELKVNSYVYMRLITHLKYFSYRIVKKKKINSTYDKKLELFVKTNYKLAYSCALAMKRYIASKYMYEIVNDEIIYLTLHLENLEKEK